MMTQDDNDDDEYEEEGVKKRKKNIYYIIENFFNTAGNCEIFEKRNGPFNLKLKTKVRQATLAKVSIFFASSSFSSF
jgi:hypothetical protein